MPVGSWSPHFHHPKKMGSQLSSSTAVGVTCCSPRSYGWLCLICVLLVGCGEGAPERLKVYPVEGTVTLKGKPLANALVVLHPKDKSDPKLTAARGTSDATGRFVISTYETNDGAPAGEYAVTVQKYELIDKGGSSEPGPNVLPPKIAQPTSTDIFVQVAEGTNTLKPLEVGR